MAHPLQNHTGVRIQFRWVRCVRSVDDDEIESFISEKGASTEVISVVKRLLTNKILPYKELLKLRSRIRQDWVNHTLPSLDKGIRLIANDKIPVFQARMLEWLNKFNEAVDAFDREWNNVKELMRAELGEFYREEDYILSPKETMGLLWDYVALQLPDYLPEEVYAVEVKKFEEKMQLTLALIRRSLLEEFSDLVHHLVDRLTVDPETGEKRRFKKSTVENLAEFLQKFREFYSKIGSGDKTPEDEELEQLISRAERIAAGIDVEKLREDESFRKEVRTEFKEIEDALARVSVPVLDAFYRKLNV